ncbi:MAG: hypothetical protein CMC21_04025 [Flavobacteriaceae bacterium]|nr:hypothetical protein [Flavobacteriaceae bacterium]
MLLNLSYNDQSLKEKINLSVGSPFSLLERLKKKGVGSPRLIISESSINIHNLLILDKNINFCNIEIRPKGIIIRFRSLLETYGLVVPFYKLKLYKGKANQYSIYNDSTFIKIEVKKIDDHAFFKKLSTEKNSYKY